MNTILLVLVLVLAADTTLAQPPPPLEGRTILAVRVSGLDHVKESVVLTQMESAPGQPYLKATADRDIVRLDRLGVFAAISLTPVAVDGRRAGGRDRDRNVPDGGRDCARGHR